MCQFQNEAVPSVPIATNESNATDCIEEPGHKFPGDRRGRRDGERFKQLANVTGPTSGPVGRKTSPKSWPLTSTSQTLTTSLSNFNILLPPSIFACVQNSVQIVAFFWIQILQICRMPFLMSLSPWPRPFQSHRALAPLSPLQKPTIGLFKHHQSSLEVKREATTPPWPPWPPWPPSFDRNTMQISLRLTCISNRRIVKSAVWFFFQSVPDFRGLLLRWCRRVFNHVR